MRRAFRQRIDPAELLASERLALESSGIVAPVFQAFLAWRRSLLFMVAVLLIPVIGFHFYDLSQVDPNLPDVFQTLQGLQVAVEVLFAVAAWSLLKQWTHWAQQRRRLFKVWILYFSAPFALQLYPYRSAFPDDAMEQGQALMMGIVFSVASMMTLAPKAFALLPGILRASIICKMLFPGSSAPGWLVTMMGPIYAVLIYILMVMPLQISGSGLFIASMVGLIGAQLYLSKQGLKLARPESYEDAVALIKKVRAGYLVLNAIGISFAVIAMAGLFDQLSIPWTSIVSLLVGLAANVLLLTLIATDLLIVNLRRADAVARDPSTLLQREAFSQSISSFAGDDR